MCSLRYRLYNNHSDSIVWSFHNKSHFYVYIPCRISVICIFDCVGSRYFYPVVYGFHSCDPIYVRYFPSSPFFNYSRRSSSQHLAFQVVYMPLFIYNFVGMFLSCMIIVTPNNKWSVSMCCGKRRSQLKKTATMNISHSYAILLCLFWYYTSRRKAL